MHDDHGTGAVGQQRLDSACRDGGFQQAGDVSEDGSGPARERHVGGGHEVDRWLHHLIARTNPRCQEREVESGCCVGHRHRMAGAAQIRELVLEGRYLWS